MSTTTTATEPATAAPSRTPARVENPYLKGNFAPVERESTCSTLEVDGELPEDLNGLLLRNGPNPAGAVATSTTGSWATRMLHAIAFRDGRARSYRNRWVRTEPLRAEARLARGDGQPAPDAASRLGQRQRDPSTRAASSR